MHILNRSIALLIVFLLAVFTPLVAAAASAEAVPIAGNAPLFTSIALAGLGVGAVITLRAKDSAGHNKLFALDPDKPQEAAEAVAQYEELKAQEVKAPLEAIIQRLKAEITLLREKIAGEILRVRKLTAQEPEKFDLEAEKLYLMGDEAKNIEPLSVERLLLEFDRLPKREELKVEPATTADKPEDPADPYAAVKA